VFENENSKEMNGSSEKYKKKPNSEKPSLSALLQGKLV